MIALDTNILVYAHRADAPWHVEASAVVRALAEGPAAWSIPWPSVHGGRVTGAKVHDARIAALCIHHGARELWTADRDFSRFPALPVRNPLVG